MRAVTDRHAVGTRLGFRAAVLLASIGISACATSVETDDLANAPAVPIESAVPLTPPRSTTPPMTASTTTTSPPPTTTTLPSTTTTLPPASATTTTLLPTTSTTVAAPTTVPALDVFDPGCVVAASMDGSLEEIATEVGIDDLIGLWMENDQMDSVSAGDLIDVCPSNLVDDIDGSARAELDDDALVLTLVSNVQRQQTKLNEIFAGYGIADLAVDGVSGPLTRQRLCAARLSLGLPTSIADMSPGSTAQMELLAATRLQTPASTATQSARWVLIDRTCQIMFVGAEADTTFVFPTSTGTEGFETREQDRAETFRFNPALDNDGWHNSSEYPVGVDNPLNGNLYKPLYFDLGQAIHGANNVPPVPASKGCARLSVADQTALLAWLGLDDAPGETWRKSEMNVTVNVQGEWDARDES